MIVTIGSDQLATAISFEDLGTSESFESLGTSESYWSLCQCDSHIASGSFSMIDRLEERSVCSFQVVDEADASVSGTGIELDKQACVRSKTALEAWQVRKTDNRWS